MQYRRDRTINRLNNVRAPATRCEKRAFVYLGTVTLAALTGRLRT
ncbi:hypothetical protein ACFW9O_14105 [Streptomyces sp. NPDC059499]